MTTPSTKAELERQIDELGTDVVAHRRNGREDAAEALELRIADLEARLDGAPELPAPSIDSDDVLEIHELLATVRAKGGEFFAALDALSMRLDELQTPIEEWADARAEIAAEEIDEESLPGADVPPAPLPEVESPGIGAIDTEAEAEEPVEEEPAPETPAEEIPVVEAPVEVVVPADPEPAPEPEVPADTADAPDVDEAGDGSALPSGAAEPAPDVVIEEEPVADEADPDAEPELP
jgi:hypothetical protein